MLSLEGGRPEVLTHQTESGYPISVTGGQLRTVAPHMLSMRIQHS